MSDEHYQIDGNTFTIYDPELGINITADIDIESKVIEYEGDTKVSECYYKEDNLHGPSAFYGDNGECLSYRWFVNGLCQGKVYEYYPSGQLSSLQRYKNGMREGDQKYFFKDGSVKTKTHYESGQKQGTARLYYASGRLKRELHYVADMRHGFDRMWNAAGALILEEQYEKGKLCETALR
jgi:antitoxin component YwqK of YwqJK toxin-antitoxin module